MADHNKKHDHHDHNHAHSHDHHDRTAPDKLPLKEQFAVSARYMKQHWKQSAAVLTSLLLGTTAFFTPAIDAAIGAGSALIGVQNMMIGGAAGIAAGTTLLLWQNSDTAVDHAAAVGEKKNWSPLALGLGIGMMTTLPEILVSVGAIMRGETAIGFGNLIGANIAHTLLILGAAAAVAGIGAVKSKAGGLSWGFNTAVMAGAAGIFGAQLLLGTLSPVAGVALVGLAAFYIGKRLYNTRNAPKTGEKQSYCFHDHGHGEKKPGALNADDVPVWFNGAWAIAALAGLAFASHHLVSSSSSLAIGLGISSAVVGVLVGLGNSLPELFISIKAAKKKMTDMALGNVLGCNIFNTLVVGGVISLVGGNIPEHFHPGTALGLLNIGTFLGSTALLGGVLLANKGGVKKWQGYAAIGLYAAYLGATALIAGDAMPGIHQHFTAPTPVDIATTIPFPAPGMS